MPSTRCGGSRGQATPLLAACLVVAAVLLAGLATVGRAVVDRTRAGAAADAAALAGGLAGRSEAEAVARLNGGRLVDYVEGSGEVTVVVAVGDRQATARAEVTVTGGGAVVGRTGLDPRLLAALARADALLGTTVPISSGFRTRAQQAALWQRRASNPYPVARPGSSRHETGRAVDIPSSFVPRVLTVAAQAGLCQPLPRTDPVHFELC